MNDEISEDVDREFYLLNLGDGRTLSPSGKLLEVLIKIQKEREAFDEAITKRLDVAKTITRNGLDLRQKSVYQSRAEEANNRRIELYGRFDDPVLEVIQEAIKLPNQGFKTRDLLISWENQIYGRKMSGELYRSLNSLKIRGRKRLSPVRVLNYARRKT